MLFNKIISAAVAFSGIATAAALPAHLVARSGSAAPAVASAPPAASTPPPVASTPPTTPAPATTTTPVTTSAPPVTTTLSSTTTTTTPPAATPTWKMDILVGSSSFNIGDADSTTFEGLWDNVCHENGCDGGSPQPFSYNGVSAGIEEKMSGTFTMTGSVNNDQTITNDLLDAINAALQGSKSCSQQNAQSCALKKRETPGVALDCSEEKITQCTMANYIQATLYDDTSSQKGQITMSATSESDNFDCDAFFGAMNGAATSLDLAPPIVGATVFAQIICDAIEGN